MKIYKIIVLLLVSSGGFAFANTYVWEDYDDFSGSSLDTSKWGTMYLGGGTEPYVTGGKLALSALSGNPSATKVVKTGWEDIFQGDDGGQAWVYPKDSEIMGIEAEFIIPSSASSMSGLALGVASLDPFSSATAELNAEPNSASQYSQGFGFYHLMNGSDVENFGTTERNITHRLGATLIDGKIKLYVNGEVRYDAEAGTFNTDMFFLNGFNDYQQQSLAFELTADNVRVLRRATTTSLDGTTLYLTAAEGVSSSLVFENGTFTSTFVDPQEGTIVEAGQSYILDQITQDTWKITLDDGDTLSFDESTGTGVSEDFAIGNFSEDNSYELISGNLYKDLHGSGPFTFTKEEGEDTITVISDPNGQAVVVQAGEKYNWNSVMTGVTLWTVAKSSAGWVSMTMRFENGRNFGKEGFHDSVALPQTYDMLFVIDENGYIKVTETSGYQYYNAVSIESGVIGTIQNDEGVDSVANNGVNQVDQWFFTTRAAAEEFYYSKAGNPKGWLWFEHYPWVYSHKEQGWLFLKPSGGKLMYYSHNNGVWREFSQ
jgi:hypothetical protein